MAALAFVVVGTLALSPTPVSAQASSASLSIAPKKTYLIEPGKTVDDKLTIRNLDRSSDLQLNLRVVDFTYTGDGGTPKLFLDENAPQTTWSLKPYLKVPKTVTIPKGGSKSLDTKLTIPAGRGGGSLYSAIIYSTGAPDGGNVGLAASGVTLVFAQIPGKVNESLKLEKFGAYNEIKREYIYFTNDEPQRIAYTLKNEGNVTEAPVGSITLNGWFGNRIIIDNVNPSESLALIGQSRTYTACIKLQTKDVELNGSNSTAKDCISPGLWPGYYSASLELYYGQNGNKTQEVLGSSSFWYLPWWFIVVMLVLLAILGFGIWKLVRFVRRKLGYSDYKKAPRRKR